MSRKGLEEDGILLNWKLWHRKQPMHDDEMRGWVDRLFGELYAQAEGEFKQLCVQIMYFLFVLDLFS